MFEGGLDIAWIVIMAYFFLRGLFRGVVKEVVAVLGLFVAFWVAGVNWPLGAEHLKTIFDVPGQRGISSFIVIFLVVYFLISLISLFVDKIVKLTLSPVVSSILGGIVGFIKGVLVCAILLAGAEAFLRPTEKFFTESKLWPYIQPVTNQARAWMPEALRSALGSNRLSSLVGELGENASETARAISQSIQASIENVDWGFIQNLLKTNPQAISPAWQDKLRNISSGTGLSQEDLRRFISDHPALFSKPSTPAAPSWPQPASE
jgi:membrane protein required for colicin V production